MRGGCVERAIHGLSGYPGDPRFQKRAESPFLQFPWDLRAGDDAEARLELRARERWELGWKRAGLNVRV